MPLVPIQAITAIISALAGLIGLIFFFALAMVRSCRFSDCREPKFGKGEQRRWAPIIEAVDGFPLQISSVTTARLSFHIVREMI